MDDASAEDPRRPARPEIPVDPEEAREEPEIDRRPEPEPETEKRRRDRPEMPAPPPDDVPEVDERRRVPDGRVPGASST